MAPIPDDLPCSPSGRIPQWVIDEAAGNATQPTGWRMAEPLPVVPSRRTARRGLRAAATVLVVFAVLGGGWWLVTGDHMAAVLTSAASRPQGPVGRVPAPSATVVQLADAAHLSSQGRAIFYGTAPRVLDAKSFAGQCVNAPTMAVLADGAVGCYLTGLNKIVVYEPADPRLHGFAVLTVAHETLHAAWETLTAGERDRLVPLLEAAVAPFPADSTLQKELAGSVGSHPQNRPTEMFAYVGTLVAPGGGVDPVLEAVYTRFIADRTALVAVNTADLALLDGMNAAIQGASTALAVSETKNAQDRAQQAADAASVAFYQRAYDAKVAEVAAMAPTTRNGLQLSWTWWDGTRLPLAPAQQTLSAAAALLTRDHAALSQRATSTAAAEAAAATERVRIRGLVDDLNGLQIQLDPAKAAVS